MKAHGTVSKEESKSEGKSARPHGPEAAPTHGHPTQARPQSKPIADLARTRRRSRTAGRRAVRPASPGPAGQRRLADAPTRMAMVSSSLTPSSAPISAQVTSGTVTKPSRLAEGWTEGRATRKSLSSMRSPRSRSSERGSRSRSSASSLCSSSLTGASEGRDEKPSVCGKLVSVLLKIITAVFL